MNQSQLENQSQEFSEKITKLELEAKENPDDLMAKINLATAFEEEELYYHALDIYEEIVAQDKEGVFGETAAKAVEEIKKGLFIPEEIEDDDKEEEEENSTSSTFEQTIKSTSDLVKKIADLPIGFKQFIALFLSSLISILGVVLAGRFIIILLGRSQLETQAVTELEVSVINYNSRINEMETGFRGQSDNTAIIDLAREYNQTGTISPELRNTVHNILVNEVSLRQIEYATLVGKDSKIIVNANKNRTGQIFNPNNLVQDVLDFPRRLQTNAIVSWEEISKENPFLPNNVKEQNVLVNFSFNPVKDPTTQEVIGLLIAGEIVNGKTLALKKTLEAVKGGYSGIYMYDNDQFKLVTSVLQTQEEEEIKTNIPLPHSQLLERSELGTGGDLVERIKINQEWFTFAVKDLPNNQGDEIAFIIRGAPESELDYLLHRSLRLQLMIGGFSLIVSIILAIFFGKALTKPIKRLQESAQKIGSGDRQARVEVHSKDEVGQLAITFNEMAGRIEAYTQAIEEMARDREKEAEFQKQEKESLQQGVINLLLDIEEASKGNLTVKARVIKGEVGSIADAFNATIKGLENLVRRVIIISNKVHGSAIINKQSVTNFSNNANTQDKVIETVGYSIGEMSESIQKVSESAQDAAIIARQSLLAAKEGENTMDKTVDSIYQVRDTVADTSKKAKRLAESSLEISKIVGIISNISEKTNLLAFNASIEAARAGENGQGFRVVADEVRRLAEQVTLSTQEIEQVVNTIQEETSQMVQTMETSTTQVVNSTKLVKTTKETLQTLANISQKIDTVLSSISESTVNQKLTSQEVLEKMQQVSVVTKETVQESQSVCESLEDLVKTAIDLQKSASRFQVK